MDYPDLIYYKDEDDKIQIRELLKKLTLYKFYKEVDEEFYKKVEKIHCEKCNEMLESTAISEPELLKLCIGVCNFILDKGNDKYFCNKSSCNNSCSHMKFRLHDHVIKNIKSPDNIKNFYEALKSISKNAKSKLKDCSIENYNMIENKFTNFKYLYEFYFNYMDISKNFFKGGDINAKLYCKYIKFFFRFYNTIKDNCSPQKKFKYCNILDELRKRFIIQGEITNVYEKCNYEETSCEEGTNVSTDIPCLTEKKNGSTVQKLGGDPNDNTIIKILLNVLIYLIPILTTFTILYKFTPIGSLIRSRMNKRKNMLEHVYENNYDHLGNISKDEVPNSDSRDYNVLYQSDKNI